MARADPQSTSGERRDANGDARRAGETARLERRRIGQAIRFHHRGEYERAIRIYRWFLARNPDCARVLQIYGLALHRTGDLDGAVRKLSRSVAINPDDSSTHASLGSVFYQQGRLEDALISIELAIDADPNSADACNDRGNVLRDL